MRKKYKEHVIMLMSKSWSSPQLLTFHLKYLPSFTFKMSTKSLQETTVAITGAAGGLGKAVAKAFLEAGSNVAICDVNPDRLAQTQEEFKHYASKLLISQTDITDEDAVVAFAASIVQTFGSLDIFINNAGIMDTFDPVGTTTKASWDRVISVNLTGLFLCTKAAVNVMESTGGGVIISVGSNASYRGMSAGAAYTASKHGLLGLVRNTAGFYSDKGIFSVALMLGGMEDTNIQDAFQTAGLNQTAMGVVMGKNPGWETGNTSVPLGVVAKYCLFLADRGVATAANGGAINVNKNWPTA